LQVLILWCRALSCLADLAMLSHIVGLVTGGASGLGAATATSLIRQGARVVVADLASQRDAYHRLADSIRADISTDAGTRRITFAETDVTSPEQVTQALDAAETAFGEPVNAAINCAGLAAARKLVSVNLKKGQCGRKLQCGALGSRTNDDSRNRTRWPPGMYHPYRQHCRL
jgi:NAD(P)-dependent dehydrogenase (short-subunit alcohol dehydrogenase family)